MYYPTLDRRSNRQPAMPARPRHHSPGETGDYPKKITRRQGGLRRMPDLLGRVLDPEARRRGLAEARLLTEWARIIGPDMATRCQPVSLTRQGVLHLHASGSAAMELQHTALQVVERINVFFGRPAVTNLRLIQAPRPRRTFVDKTPPPPPDLSADERQAIAKTVEKVAHDDLRRALETLGGTLRQHKPRR